MSGGLRRENDSASLNDVQVARRGRAVLAVGTTTFALASVLLMVAPITAAASPSYLVILKPAFSGTGFGHVWAYNSTGGGCNGAGSYSVYPPFFSARHGRGYADPFVSSVPCSSWSTQYEELYSEFGLNSTAFSPPFNVAHAGFRFHWTLNYYLYANTTYGGGNETSYAVAEVGLEGWVADLTTGKNHYSSNSFYNETSRYDTTGSGWVTPSGVKATIFLNMSLLSTHSYVFHTYVYVLAYAETYGSTSSVDHAYAQVDWPGIGPAGNLNSVYY
ncbi:MAG: hypothetical protein L3K09_01515 [Thermoplasmata archaeon]|nr:hypothetical protein [Thermoplasmata archaeon]